MELLGTFGAVIGLAGTVGAASAIFYASRSRAVITLLKEENDALGKANLRLEKDNEVLIAKCEAEAEKAKILIENVTQAPSIKELTKVMTDQNKEVINALSSVATELAALTKAIGASIKPIRRKVR